MRGINQPRTPSFEQQVAYGVPPNVAYWRLTDPPAGEVTTTFGGPEAADLRKPEARFSERQWHLLRLAGEATTAELLDAADLEDALPGSNDEYGQRMQLLLEDA